MSQASVVFVTLFLSLTIGEHPVELAVEGQVARVEIHLDGCSIGVLEHPPWRFDCDFGVALRPRRLEAVAFDGGGRQVARADQVVNLPRSPVEAQIQLTRDERGVATGARLVVDAVTDRVVESVRVVLDGEPIVSPDIDSIVLPAHDPSSLHVLRAEIGFADGLSARADASFGGFLGDEVRSALTAVPIVLGTGVSEVSREQLDGLLQVAGAPARVAAVERGDTELWVVQSDAARQMLREADRLYVAREAPGGPGGVNRYYQTRHRMMVRRVLPPEDPTTAFDRLRSVAPYADVGVSDGVSVFLFPIGDLLRWDRKCLPWMLNQRLYRAEPKGEQRLADAVAVAAVHSVVGGRPRAVLLVTEPDPQDHSGYVVETVRGYLRSLRVPLYVWSTGRKPGAPSPWGPCEIVGTVNSLRRSARDLESDLERQRIVWIEGAHLPTEIGIADGATGIRLAGVD